MSYISFLINPKGNGRNSILIIDDDADILNAAALLLKRHFKKV